MPLDLSNVKWVASAPVLRNLAYLSTPTGHFYAEVLRMGHPRGLETRTASVTCELIRLSGLLTSPKGVVTMPLDLSNVNWSEPAPICFRVTHIVTKSGHLYTEILWPIYRWKRMSTAVITCERD